MLDIIIVFAYLSIALILGLWVGKSVGSSDDFFTGGRNYPAWAVFATLSAAFLGGGFTLGIAEKAFLYGLIYATTIFGFSLKEILIAFFVVPRVSATFQKAVTVGSIMEIAFGKQAKIVTGFASVLVCGGIIGAQIAACGSIVHILLGPPPAIGALLAASIVIVYATLGGMKAVVAVDILHFCIFSLIFPVLLFFGIQHIGGWDVFSNAIVNHVHSPNYSIDITDFSLLFLSFFLGETLVPPYVLRMFIGKTTRETKQGTLWSGIFSIFFFTLMGCLGSIAFLLEPGLSADLALPYVIETVMPIGLKGLAIAALLATIMSSVDSFLNSIALAVSHDILTPLNFIRNNNKDLMVIRIVTFVIGVVAIFISITMSCSLDILLYSYQFWTPFILAPLLAAIFGIRSSDKVFLISTASGVLGVILWNVMTGSSFQESMNFSIKGTIIGIALNTIVLIGCHYSLAKSHSANRVSIS